MLRGEPAPLPWAAWVSRAGWAERKQRFLASAKSIYTLAKLRKHLKPWSLPDFKASPACGALGAVQWHAPALCVGRQQTVACTAACNGPAAA